MSDFALHDLLFLAFGLFARPNWHWADTRARWGSHHWTWTGTLALGIILTFLAEQYTMIVFSTGIEFVMVVTGLALLGSAMRPSVRNAYRDDNR